MKKYIYTLLEEKNIDLDTAFTVIGESGDNFMTVGVIVEHILIAPKSEQKNIKNMLVRIDFNNGDILDFIKHLAKAIAR